MKTNSKFKYYMIGSVVLAILLVIGIILLSGNRSQAIPDELKEDTVNTMSISRYGQSENEEEYIVYLYHPRCSYCQQLMNSDTYQDFIANPSVRMYKISTNNDPNIEDYNPNYYEGFIDAIDISGTPSMYYIKKASEDKYYVEKAVGYDECKALLEKFTA